MNWDQASLSRDIASAMFRVAAVAKNGKIRDAIEDSAILLVFTPAAPSIKQAEEIIRLGEAVGEVKPINVRVLVRELNNLKKLIQDEEAQYTNVDISSLFGRTTPAETEDIDYRESAGVLVENKVSKQQSESSSHPSTNVAKNHGRASLYNSGQKLAASGDNSTRRSSVNSDKIYLYINERGQARLKELESAFPEVSGRTLRRATDILIKEGRIERVGNPGPSSFYRPLTRSSVEREGSPATPASPHVIPAEAGIQSPGPSTPENHAPNGAVTVGTFQRIAPQPSFMRAIQGGIAE